MKPPAVRAVISMRHDGSKIEVVVIFSWKVIFSWNFFYHASCFVKVISYTMGILYLTLFLALFAFLMCPIFNGNVLACTSSDNEGAH